MKVRVRVRVRVRVKVRVRVGWLVGWLVGCEQVGKQAGNHASRNPHHEGVCGLSMLGCVGCGCCVFFLRCGGQLPLPLRQAGEPGGDEADCPARNCSRCPSLTAGGSRLSADLSGPHADAYARGSRWLLVHGLRGAHPLLASDGNRTRDLQPTKLLL